MGVDLAKSVRNYYLLSLSYRHSFFPFVNSLRLLRLLHLPHLPHLLRLLHVYHLRLLRTKPYFEFRNLIHS